MVEQASLFGDGTLENAVQEPAPAVIGGDDEREHAAARVAELNHLLEYHAYRYYIRDAPEITDAAFDKLLLELQGL